MDELLKNVLIKAIQDGDIASLIGYGLVYYFIWSEVRGMKKELSTLNKTVNSSFKAGELRFEAIEKKTSDFDHRLTRLENFTTETHNRLYELETKDGTNENNNLD